jgi:hypothetical protein
VSTVPTLFISCGSLAALFSSFDAFLVFCVEMNNDGGHSFDFGGCTDETPA